MRMKNNCIEYTRLKFDFKKGTLFSKLNQLIPIDIKFEFYIVEKSTKKYIEMVNLRNMCEEDDFFVGDYYPEITMRILRDETVDTLDNFVFINDKIPDDETLYNGTTNIIESCILEMIRLYSKSNKSNIEDMFNMELFLSIENADDVTEYMKSVIYEHSIGLMNMIRNMDKIQKIIEGFYIDIECLRQCAEIKAKKIEKTYSDGKGFSYIRTPIATTYNITL